jgi:exodeoxyribonuclease VII small subunit
VSGRFIDRYPLIALPFRFTCIPPPLSFAGIHRPMSKPAKTPTFETALAELEEIVSDMEAGQLPLEKSLAAYQRGAELLKFCQSALQDAQQQVKILEDGVLKNFGVAEP